MSPSCHERLSGQMIEKLNGKSIASPPQNVRQISSLKKQPHLGLFLFGDLLLRYRSWTWAGFFDHPFSGITNIFFMKIVYPINIDDFPPFLCHKVSPDDSDESYQKIDFERHEPSERIIEDIEWYDSVSCEDSKRRKINSKGDDRRKYHHEEGIEESFHKKKNNT